MDWARRFILFQGKRHPKEMGAVEVTAFLSHLAVEFGIDAGSGETRTSVLYREVPGIELPWLDEVVAAKVGRRLPGC